jgi:hypothetical protein
MYVVSLAKSFSGDVRKSAGLSWNRLPNGAQSGLWRLVNPIAIDKLLGAPNELRQRQLVETADFEL